LLGVVPFWSDYYQSDDLGPLDGTLGEGIFNARIRARGNITDNTFSAKWGKGTWKLGFDYLVNDDTFVYGTLATGFKAGGFGDLIDICGGCGILEAFQYDPEEVTALIEAPQEFIDANPNNPNDPNDPNNIIVPCADGSIRCFEVPASVSTLLTTNVAAASIKGLEVEIDWRPYDTGRITGWVSYLDAEIKELPNSVDGYYCFERAYLGLSPCAPESDTAFDDQGNPLRLTSYDGNQLPWSPEWSFTINWEHNWYFENGLRLSPYVSFNWQDEVFFNNNNFDEGAFHSGQPALSTISASLRLINEDKAWGAEIYVNNATDERIRYWSDGGPGYLRSSFAPPRSYGFRFNYNF